MAGSILFLCLVLLTTLTLLGLAAASEFQLQARIVANQHHVARAMQAASHALSQAENWLFSLEGGSRPEPCGPDCNSGAIVRSSAFLPSAPAQAPAQWWQEHGQTSVAESSGDSSRDGSPIRLEGHWIIAEIDIPETLADTNLIQSYYRVLARGTSGLESQVTVVESIVARPWGDESWSDAQTRSPAQDSFCQSESLIPCGRIAWRQLR